MMTDLVATLLPALVLVAVFISNERASRQRAESHQALILVLVAAHDRDRDLWTRERQLMLNRIKPETAQIMAVPGPVHTPAAVAFDDDEDFWKSKDPTSDMSTAELAEALMEMELEDRDGVAG